MPIPPNPLIALAALLGAMVIVSDLYARRVPNMWLFGALLLGVGTLIIDWIQGTGGPPWPALLGLLAGLTALLPLHAFGWMGAGDVKFFAVLGFLLGATALIPIWIIASLISGVHALLILLSRNVLTQAVPGLGVTQNWFANSAFGQRLTAVRQGRQGLPYAAWLGVGSLIVIFNPVLLHW
ncbi:prepilin peptidase [Fulvimonas sp. R45]|uniref:A24 family peptidase n=1 Tax=Fulvimonas sp. R45 TaxID=3045937 RepID=UPI00265F9F81|nr:prepilin peptidase [Fulvimonas sp. R45]MDO1528437.1 prepilin peptidase [Fulvimonas sp. R45]